MFVQEKKTLRPPALFIFFQYSPFKNIKYLSCHSIRSKALRLIDFIYLIQQNISKNVTIAWMPNMHYDSVMISLGTQHFVHALCVCVYVYVLICQFNVYIFRTETDQKLLCSDADMCRHMNRRRRYKEEKIREFATNTPSHIICLHDCAWLLLLVMSLCRSIQMAFYVPKCDLHIFTVLNSISDDEKS